MGVRYFFKEDGIVEVTLQIKAKHRFMLESRIPQGAITFSKMVKAAFEGIGYTDCETVVQIKYPDGETASFPLVTDPDRSDIVDTEDLSSSNIGLAT